VDPAAPREREGAGLCASCAHAGIVTSARGTQFYLCGLSRTDPRFARYPRLPVLVCSGYSPTAEPACHGGGHDR
jgi:hypothetical protein